MGGAWERLIRTTKTVLKASARVTHSTTKAGVCSNKSTVHY